MIDIFLVCVFELNFINTNFMVNVIFGSIFRLSYNWLDLQNNCKLNRQHNGKMLLAKYFYCFGSRERLVNLARYDNIWKMLP